MSATQQIPEVELNELLRQHYMVSYPASPDPGSVLLLRAAHDSRVAAGKPGFRGVLGSWQTNPNAPKNDPTWRGRENASCHIQAGAGEFGWGIEGGCFRAHGNDPGVEMFGPEKGEAGQAVVDRHLLAADWVLLNGSVLVFPE